MTVQKKNSVFSVVCQNDWAGFWNKVMMLLSWGYIILE